MTANRVQPDGTFASQPERGAFMGNRGCLHDNAGIIRHRHQTKLWITCTLREKPGRGKVPQRAAGRYTPLFFLDEAVACAAGHRPCAECRRAVYNDFRTAWGRAFGAIPKAAEIDAILHAARFDPETRHKRLWQADLRDLPTGTFVLCQDHPHLVWDGMIRRWHAAGYGDPRPLPAITVQVLTPEPLVRVMQADWRPSLTAEEDRPNW